MRCLNLIVLRPRSAQLVLVACTLLLRPHNWGAWGGLEYVPQMIRYPRIGLIAIGICIALAAGALAWGAAGHKRLGTLALAPLGLLAAAISARIGGPVSAVLETHGVMGAKGLPDDVREYLGALVLLSWIGKASGILIAILGVVFAFLRPQQRAGKLRLAPAVAVSITFGLIVMAYAYSYLPNGRISNLLTIPHPGTGSLVPLRFSQSMALELILMSTLLGFAVVVVNYGGRRLSHNCWVSTRQPSETAFPGAVERWSCYSSWLVPKSFGYIGFSNQLPKILGGSADYWYNAGVHPALSAIWAGLILTPTTLLAISKIRSGIRDGENAFKQGLAASLGVAVAATYASAVESGSYVLKELITPLRTVNFEAPLYIAHPSLSG